ncbi:hypothetical protein [Frondihabitans cladoniiphilus]|uniref:hypothetical protein n=1 Tax=Frondihabitans cladoniiphilus TaxID=715785 RepID=UPI0031E9EA26
MSSPDGEAQQRRYQVRFDWGETGARRIASGAHVVVVADELDGHGQASAAQLAAAVAEASGPAAAVFSVTEACADDAAARILALQASLGDRAVVAIVAAGSLDDDGFRAPVEDLLAAGAVVDALATQGIDFASPEAAAACAAFVGLRRATAHLSTSTVSAAHAWPAGGNGDARAQRDAHPAVVSVLREYAGGLLG